MLERLATWLARQDDLFTLTGLDDRMLADMGLERAELRRRVMRQGDDVKAARARLTGWAALMRRWS